MMAEQLTTVPLSTFSTIRTEWLSEYLAAFLPCSWLFDVCSQQLCINGPVANQKPTRAWIGEFPEESLLEVLQSCQ